MTEYRVICIVRGSDGRVQARGYSESGQGVMYDDRWTLEQARAAIEKGHQLYTVNPSTGERAELELEAGERRIKFGWRSDQETLGHLPECG